MQQRKIPITSCACMIAHHDVQPCITYKSFFKRCKIKKALSVLEYVVEQGLDQIPENYYESILD